MASKIDHAESVRAVRQLRRIRRQQMLLEDQGHD